MSVGLLLGISATVVLEAVLIWRADAKASRGLYACQWNLFGIRHALSVYADNNDGYFAPSLEVLAEERLVPPGSLVCPVSGKRYVYPLQGLTVKENQIPEHYPVLMERGFPHSWLSSYDPRWGQKRLKEYTMYITDGVGWQYCFLDDWADWVDEDPRVLMRFEGLPTELSGVPETREGSAPTEGSRAGGENVKPPRQKGGH